MGQLDGKVAIVSGAARGQGEAEARLFVEEGAHVVLGDVLDDRGRAVADDLGDAARYVHLDVSQEDDWVAAVRETETAFGPVSVLVNNAGILKFAPLAEMTLDDYLAVIDVNQIGCFLGMRAVAPSMERAGGGSIVNISSINGLVGYPGTMGYTASKWAIRGMTKAAAMELGPLGIRVNSIHPGAVDTEMVRPAGMEGMPDAEEQATLFAAYPLRRNCQPIEIARVALFLASDRASYATGAEFVADGGMLAGPLNA
jgi:3alpha(or 20beta)-hydroxysteroid dehydrogenase